MARIRNDEDFNKKKHDITQSALGILLEEGAEKLSINYLLRKTNMAKGVFFHYFKSKEELLVEVFDCASKPIIENMQCIEQEKGLHAVDKLIKLYQSVGSIKADYGKGLGALSKVLYRKDNKLFLMAFTERMLVASLPIFEKIILEGANSGDFYVENTNAAAYHILTMTWRLNREIGEYLFSDHSEANRVLLMGKITLGENIVGSILNCDVSGKLYQLATLKRIGIF